MADTAGAGAVDSLALPWLAAPLRQALAQARGHALLVHGPEGVGQFEFALELARAWLCEAPGRREDETVRLACGQCAACRLVDARSHPDLRIVVPEALRGLAGLPDDGAEAGDGEGGGKKRKPSREIKVEQVRQALDFSELSGARSGRRVLLLHPAEQLNTIAANALLKTLEEPAGDLRFVLACGASAALLPTVRSRCQDVRLAAPPREQARPWLMQACGVDSHDADTLLDVCEDQALAARELVALGLPAQAWRDLPANIARGDAAALAHWPLPTLVQALQKLCVDLGRQAVGAAPRHFAPKALGELLPRPARAARGGSTAGAAEAAPVEAAARSSTGVHQDRLLRLTAWGVELRRMARHAEHPWSQALAVEALVLGAQQATLGR